MSEIISRLRWNIIAPVALILVALAGVAWLDLATGGEAEPEPLLGAVGTPVRGTFVPPTATPPGFRPPSTPRPRPVTGAAPGTPEERDGQRRMDLLLLLDAAEQYRDRNGEYPTTGNNVQTLCAYKELDQGCKLGSTLGRDVPGDPLGDPLKNGYWYQSDGRSLKLYASLEVDIPSEQQCPTDNPDLLEQPNLICITAP